MSDSSTSRRAAATATLVFHRRRERQRARAARDVAVTCATSGRAIADFPAGPCMPSRRPPTAIWIGAEKGLVRFDGLTFRLLEPKGTPNTAPAVLGVVAAPDGSVWARLRGMALLRYQHEAFENILPRLGNPESVVTAMERGLDNSILAATLGRGAMISRNGRVDGDRGHEGAAGIVVRHFDCCNAERRLLARDTRRRRAPRPGHSRHPIHGRVSGPESELPARDGRSQRVDRHRQGRRAMDGERRSAGRAFGRAGESSGARDDSRSPGQRLDRGRIGRTRACGRSGTREPLGVEERARLQRVVGLRGSGRQHLGRGTDRGIERWRAIPCSPRSRRRRAFPRRPSDPCTSTIEDARGLRRRAAASSGSRTAWSAASRKRASIETSLIDRRCGRRRVGRKTARRRHASAPFDSRMVGHAFHRSRRASAEQVYAVALARDGALWAGTLSAGASRIVNGAVTTFTTASGLASNTITSIAEGLDGRSGSEHQAGSAHSRRGGWRTYTTRDRLRRTTSIRSSWVRAASSGPARQTGWRSCRTVSCARAEECLRPCARRSWSGHGPVGIRCG